jgi:hypothetical protein
MTYLGRMTRIKLLMAMMIMLSVTIILGVATQAKADINNCAHDFGYQCEPGGGGGDGGGSCRFDLSRCGEGGDPQPAGDPSDDPIPPAGVSHNPPPPSPWVDPCANPATDEIQIACTTLIY